MKLNKKSFTNFITFYLPSADLIVMVILISIHRKADELLSDVMKDLVERLINLTEARDKLNDTKNRLDDLNQQIQAANTSSIATEELVKKLKVCLI